MIKKGLKPGDLSPCYYLAGTTRLELATSGVTGRRSNQTELRPLLSIIKSYSLVPDLDDFIKEKSNLNTNYVTECMVGGTGLEPVTLGL